MKFTNLGSKDTRSGFGEALLELGRTNDNIVALCADLTGSLKMNAFANEFPDRFFQVGIAEANMIGLAAGMTIGGKIPFTGTFANFSIVGPANTLQHLFVSGCENVQYREKNHLPCRVLSDEHG